MIYFQFVQNPYLIFGGHVWSYIFWVKWLRCLYLRIMWLSGGTIDIHFKGSLRIISYPEGPSLRIICYPKGPILVHCLQTRYVIISSSISITFLFTWALSSKMKYTLFFISNTFISNTRLKMDKSLANFKQNPEAQFLVLVIKQQEFSLKSLP